jgi:hypothetical protein
LVELPTRAICASSATWLSWPSLKASSAGSVRRDLAFVAALVVFERGSRG